MDTPQFKPGDLLQKTECMQLFMDRMRISKKTYYDNFRKHIKFKPYGQINSKTDGVKNTLHRIPYEIAIGLINLLKDKPHPDDPPLEKLKEFLNNVPEGV